MPEVSEVSKEDALKYVEQIYRDRLELIIALRRVANWHTKLTPASQKSRAPSLFRWAKATVGRIDRDIPHHYNIAKALKEGP